MSGENELPWDGQSRDNSKRGSSWSGRGRWEALLLKSGGILDPESGVIDCQDGVWVMGWGIGILCDGERDSFVLGSRGFLVGWVRTITILEGGG